MKYSRRPSRQARASPSQNMDIAESAGISTERVGAILMEIYWADILEP